jgi:serine/threonine-protein kinase
MLAFSLAAACWVSYLALEPVVRRRWPDTLVSWTRLLRGRVLDPLVGRDVLVGVMGGIVNATAYAVLESVFMLLVLVLLSQLLRRTWAAVAVSLAIFIAPVYLGSPAELVRHLLVRGITWGLLVRPGLVAGVTALSVRSFLGVQLMTTHLGAWYASEAVTGIVAALALAAWGFYASLGGQSVFGDAQREAARSEVLRGEAGCGSRRASGLQPVAAEGGLAGERGLEAVGPDGGDDRQHREASRSPEE